MTLHAAIDLVLRETGRPLSSRELADEINRRRFYVRPSDGKPVRANQVAARVRRPTYRSRYRIDNDYRLTPGFWGLTSESGSGPAGHSSLKLANS